MKGTERRYVIAYDVPDTRRRNRIAAILTAHGARMQKSVFEALSAPAAMEECVARLEAVLDPAEDSLAVYRLCRNCDRSRVYFGCANDEIGDEDVFIV